MAETPSTMLPLGTQAPDFTLPDVVTGQPLSLQKARSDIATVIVFICNHCPFVLHIQDGLIQAARDYIPKGVAFIAISANDVEQFPQDGPGKMKEFAERKQFPFPYLYDETQETAKAYHAACTPDFYVFDKNMRCVYRGQFDDARPGNGVPVTGKDLRAALDNLLAGQPLSDRQRVSIGCNIKWKPGNAPAYFG